MLAVEPADEERSPFARRVNQLREELGLSQAELAGRLGTSKMRVYRIEKDEVPAKLDLIEQLAKAFGLRPIEFLAPLLGADAALLEEARLQRLSEERVAAEQAVIVQYLESLARRPLKEFVQAAVRAGQTMSDEQLDLVREMLWAWTQEFGKRRFIDAGVRSRMKERAAKSAGKHLQRRKSK